MKKLILIFIAFLEVLFSKPNQKDLYIEYTNKIINYNFQIPNLNEIKTPFFKPYKPDLTVKSTQKNEIVKKSVKLTLLAIFGNKALVKIDKFIGEQLIKSTKKWISINDKIYECKLIKLTQTDAQFKCADTVLYKTLNKKIPILGDEK